MRRNWRPLAVLVLLCALLVASAYVVVGTLARTWPAGSEGEP